MVNREPKPGSEQEQPLQPEIKYAALDRSIEFIFPTAEAAKAGALKAMRAIHLDEGIRTDIAGVDLSRGRGRVGWDYYSFYALKTDLDFEQLEDGRWLLDVSKVYSEGSSLRGEVEKTVGEPSLVSGAYIELKLPTQDQGRRYAEAVGLDLSDEQLSRVAQDKAYWRLSILIRDITCQWDFDTKKDHFDRPEDIGDVLISVAEQSDREIQSQLLGAADKRFSGTYFENGRLQFNYPGGSLEAALALPSFDPVAAIRTIFAYIDKAVKPNLLGIRDIHPGSYSHFYLECLEEAYKAVGQETKDKLYQALYAKCKARVEEKGTNLRSTLRFSSNEDRSRDDLELTERSLNVDANLPINDEHFRASVVFSN